MFLLPLLACAHRAPAPPAAAPAASTAEAGAGVCPVQTTDPPVCSDPQLGHSPERPMEIGDAGRAVLWWNRLACADGSEVAAQRAGSIGKARVPSTSPLNPSVGADWDILDRWEVPCPAGNVTLYANVYRCGEVCVPPEIRVLPSAADTEANAMFAALDAGDAETARKHLANLLAVAGDFEWALAMAALAAPVAEDPQAMALNDKLLAKWPKPIRRLNYVRMLAMAGRLDEARKALATFQAENTDAELTPRATCVAAEIAPDAATSTELAKRSCDAGFEPCCAPGGVWRVPEMTAP